MKPPLSLEHFVEKLRDWKVKLEKQVFSNPLSVSLIESSHALAVYAVADAPDLCKFCLPRINKCAVIR